MEVGSRPGLRLQWRVVIGLLIVGYGGLLTAGNVGWFPAYRILDHWYAGITMIALGLTTFTRSPTSGGRTFGLGVAAIGGLWLAIEATGTRVRIEQWWPLVIVGLGVLLIMRASDFKLPIGGLDAAGSQASGIAFWSGINRRIASSAFSHAAFAAVMGGIEVDLRPATTAGGQAVIELFVVWGGIEITVPPDWIVQNDAIVVMGGVEDKSSGSQGAKNTLILRWLILMGGVEIKT
jgi:hypothetical protein